MHNEYAKHDTPAAASITATMIEEDVQMLHDNNMLESVCSSSSSSNSSGGSNTFADIDDEIIIHHSSGRIEEEEEENVTIQENNTLDRDGNINENCNNSLPSQEDCKEATNLNRQTDAPDMNEESNEGDDVDCLGDTIKVRNSAPQHEEAISSTDEFIEDEVADSSNNSEAYELNAKSKSTSPSSVTDQPDDSPPPLQTKPTSTAKRKSPPKSKSSSSSNSARMQHIPLKESQTDGKTSLLTRGMTSLFGKSPSSSKPIRNARYLNNDNNDANSVISEISSPDAKSIKSTASSSFVSKVVDKNNNDDDALKRHLEESGLVLLKRLIEFLSECPPAPDEEQDGLSSSITTNNINNKQKKKQRGLTLPACAIGWISTQLNDSCNDAFDGLNVCYQIPKQQLECVQVLFKRVTSLRISGEAWPPPHSSIIGKGGGGDKNTKNKNVNEGNKKSSLLTTNLLSKLAGGDQSSFGGGNDSLDGDESCGTSPSTLHEVVLTPFQAYYHELQFNPNVNMSYFPNATKVVIDGIPPNWITNLDYLQRLDMFQIEKGCILDVNQLFFPSDITHTMDEIDQRGMQQRNLSLITENQEAVKEDADSTDDDGNDDTPKATKTPVVYPSLSKLRLSNCAMGEAAGLRGRRKKTCAKHNIPRVPTFERFPNLTTLNLSHNELFKTKTVFAGLSSLPLLSSINLSYNRLSCLDDIFMHIGNVTELILTGNEISSTRGLDRLFSLERLSLDDNNICNLANIAGIAKIPFLMNFDLKGNPLESEDPASCRIKVFNLFREVRCSNLSKNATFRDMQRLLPILDNELARKDELVALKDLTFRQTVISVDSMMPSSSNNHDGTDAQQSIDESTEVSVNVPDRGEGMRRVIKSAPANIANLREAGSTLLDEKAAERLKVFHDRQDYSRLDREDKRRPCIQFSMKELITTIRPKVDAGDTTCIGQEQDGTSHNEVPKSRTFSSDVITDVSSSLPAFPFSLPTALLAEAGDDVWNSSTWVDLIVPSNTIVWDITSDKEVEQQEHGIKIDCLESNSSVDGSGLSSPADGKIEDAEECGSLGDNSKQADGEKETIFKGVWEQSYRDNVTRKGTILEPADSSEQETHEMVDFNAAEKNSVYDGTPDYGPLFVASDLDLYFDSFIFHSDTSEDSLQEEVSTNKEVTAPRIQLFKFDRDTLINSKRLQANAVALSSTIDFSERYIGVWRETVLACGSYARSRLSPIQMPKRGFHGDPVVRTGKDVMVSEGRRFILCLSDSAMYFIVDDDVSSQSSDSTTRIFPSRIPPTSTFSDAYWPHAVIRHPLDCLRGITIGFQFQRLILRFCIGNASSSFEYAYVILTSNKLQTVSLLQKLQSLLSSSTDDRLPGIGALIDNDDKKFLEALGAPRSNEVVLHYQILHQIWKRGDREASRRAFVLSDARAYLLDETYTGDGTNLEDGKEGRKKLGDVSLSIIDSAKLDRVIEIRAANEDPRKITLVILPQSKLKRSHRWRLVCNDGEGAERLIDDVRKAIAMRSLV